MAGTAAADVLAVFSERQGMSGKFIQRIVTPEGELLETSEGQFSLLRPHFMRWQIESPDQQLLIVNENTLTQIDWDLEVVSSRAMTPDNRSALDWLMAPAEELEQTFDVTLHLGRRLSSPGNRYRPLSDWRLNSKQHRCAGSCRSRTARGRF